MVIVLMFLYMVCSLSGFQLLRLQTMAYYKKNQLTYPGFLAGFMKLSLLKQIKYMVPYRFEASHVNELRVLKIYRYIMVSSFIGCMSILFIGALLND